MKAKKITKYTVWKRLDKVGFMKISAEIHYLFHEDYALLRYNTNYNKIFC